VSTLTPFAALRVNSPPPAAVLKIAHGAASNVSPNPTCWNVAPVNVATNSSDRPAG
jgi:hypothetical protein